MHVDTTKYIVSADSYGKKVLAESSISVRRQDTPEYVTRCSRLYYCCVSHRFALINLNNTYLIYDHIPIHGHITRNYSSASYVFQILGVRFVRTNPSRPQIVPTFISPPRSIFTSLV